LYTKGTGWHSLRHTYCRLFLEASPDMRLLQASLGHRSVTTTEQEYGHLLPDKAAEIARVRIHGI
jgi:integrase